MLLIKICQRAVQITSAGPNDIMRWEELAFRMKWILYIMRINGKKDIGSLVKGQLGHLSNSLRNGLYRSTCRKFTIICYEIDSVVN